jgi:phytoene dehydrogenase-like protein
MASSAVPDVVVVGAGLAGLAAATYLARAGRTVVVVDKAAVPGGRARTVCRAGFDFNVGAHALYRGGAATSVLRELGVVVSGGRPTGAGGYAVRDGVPHTLPIGLVSLVTTGLLRAREKIEAARLLAGLRDLDCASWQNVSLDTWLDGHVTSGPVRELMAAIVRLATYTDAPAILSAGAALTQVRLAERHGVLYLDRGWQTIVDGLRRTAETAGARLFCRRHAVAIDGDDRVQAVRLDDGTTIPAAAVVIAGSPETARALTASAGRASATSWTQGLRPVHAAALDVALHRLPRPQARLAIGMDQPLYASVHSATARLAPDGGALVHLLRYGGLGGQSAAEVEGQLGGLLDRLQPGWRQVIAEQRFVPDLVVAHALPAAVTGGLLGRPGTVVRDLPGVFVAGDWVGPEGLLADASLASARAAAHAVLAQGGERGVRRLRYDTMRTEACLP